MSQSSLVPADFQARLPQDQLVRGDPLEEERIDVDVLFVGAGPAGLAGAIQLARLVKQDNEGGAGIGEITIGVLEKAGALGEHSLSGAVLNPRPFRELFPDVKDADFPFGTKVEKEAIYFLSANKYRRIPTPLTRRQ